MRRAIGLIVVVFLSINISYSQGCSDAGFCSMGAMKPSQIYNKKINFKLKEVEISYYKGETRVTPTINAISVDFTFGINDKTSLQVKLPYQWTTGGSLGNLSGLGDLSLSLTRNVYTAENFHINATLGGKIPSNKSNLKDGSNIEVTTGNQKQELPMYYQTSLGTYDIVAGGAYISKKWMFAAGIQIPLNANENEWKGDDWGNYPFPDYIQEYDRATHLKRGTDLMLRVERAFHFSKIDVRLGLLPIFRITKDQILSDITATNTSERIKLDGTTGLALTTILNVAYHFNTKNSAKLLYGLKLTDRDVNPDGLTRDNVISIGYAYRF